MSKKIVLSGIRPTGQLHLGNYLGALSKFVKMQNEGVYDSFYFIADLHALTTHPDPSNLHEHVRGVVAEYLAAGLDPDRSTIFIQSDVPQIPELYLLLNMHVGIGELMRTAAFKDKARKALGIGTANGADDDADMAKEIVGANSNKRVNAGLLTYPTLMAVDILIQHADFVPVGKDQEQHLELTRRFAKRFNAFYGVEYFTEPQNFNFGGQPVKVPGLDGSGKMGKSTGNCIYLRDDDKTITKKVMKAVTDSGPTEPNSEKPEVIENLFTFLRIASTPEAYQYFDEKWNDCSIRYGDLKKQIAQDLCAIVAPIRERIEQYSADTALLEKIAERGAEVARQSARATIDEVRRIIGFRL